MADSGKLLTYDTYQAGVRKINEYIDERIVTVNNLPDSLEAFTTSVSKLEDITASIAELKKSLEEDGLIGTELIRGLDNDLLNLEDRLSAFDDKIIFGSTLPQTGKIGQLFIQLESENK